MKKKYVKRLLALGLVAALTMTYVQVPGVENISQVQAADTLDGEWEDLSFDPSSTWDEQAPQDVGTLTTDEIPKVGTKVELNLLIPADDGGNLPVFSGSIKAGVVLRIGDDWDWVQSKDFPEAGSVDFTEKVTINGTDYYQAKISAAFDGTVEANNAAGDWGDMAFEDAVTGKVNAVTLKLAGYECDYTGDIAVADARIIPAEGGGAAEAALSWDFETGIDGWSYGAGWEWQYTGGGTVEADQGMLKLNLDYRNDPAYDWSQAVAVYDSPQPMDLTGVNSMTMDFFFDTSNMTNGGFKIKVYSDCGMEGDTTVNMDKLEDVTISGKTYKKYPVVLNFDPQTATDVVQFGLNVIGVNTDYQGPVYFDNVTLLKSTATEEDVCVDSTIGRNDQTGLSVNGGTLTSQKADGTSEATSIASAAALVDKNATAETAKLYAYLKAVGESDSVIFGHENDTWHKAGAKGDGFTTSDTADVTGSISGMTGIDTLSLTGNEFSASRYNDEIANEIDVTGQSQAEANVEAAAKLTNRDIQDGAIVTLSAHMPNFSLVKENADFNASTDATYAKYDFSGYTPNVLTGNVANQIMPGGQYNEVYNAYLDMVADYASQVNGPVLFRPFHECTGSWFWWGAAFCDAQTYRNIFRYTVTYLRDEKGIDNFLYVYGPGSEAANEEEYGVRYPGDDYVDMVGFDMYNTDPPADNSAWLNSLKAQLNLVEAFAQKHGKLVAVTETGVASSYTAEGDKTTVLKRSGNENKDWYNEVLETIYDSDASFLLLWANWGERDGFYTPYVKSYNENGTMHGHEMMDNFMSFFNDGRTIFAGNQTGILGQIPAVTVSATTNKAIGFITAPVSGTRILEATALQAKVSNGNKDTKVSFVLHGDKKDITLKASAGKNGYYSAKLTSSNLKKLGAVVGTIELKIDGKTNDEINATFNIQAPVEDPFQIDGFENYYGVNSLLTQKWAANKASGSVIELSLSQEDGTVFEGDYAMKFYYDETSDGWAGATISKEVDWSSCNALSFYTLPDGKNQKVVVQLTANGVVYETYLNLYEDYASAKGPLKVTIPFSEFCQRDTAGNPKGGLQGDSEKITAFGLWVNAIGDSEAVVDGRVSGTIYYDNITAITSDATQAVFEEAVKESVDPEEPEDPEDPEEPEEPENPEEPKTEEAVQTIIKEGGYNVKVLNDYEELKKIIPLTKEEKKAIKAGELLQIKITVADHNNDVTEKEKELVLKQVDGTLKGYRAGKYLDITLDKKIGDRSWSNVSQLNGNLKLEIELPKDSVSEKNTYAVIRIHEEVGSVLKDMDQKLETVTVETDQFSTYALMYSDGTAAQETKEAAGKTKTGDDTTVAGWILMLGFAAVVLVRTGKKRMKI